MHSYPIPIAGYLIVNMVITIVIKKKYDRDADKAFLDYAFSLFTPAIVGSTTRRGRSHIKATMLSSTAILLPCLIFIQILPLLSPGTPCVMATCLEDFSFFFWPLIILGAWCLFEGDTIFLSRVDHLL